MTSRLDRLFVLLETGSAGTTRRAAARQLGEVQRAHPGDLQRLLARLARHLRSPAWETRIAASQAIEAILSNVPQWDPSPCDNELEDEDIPQDPGLLQFDTFDIDAVLEHGAFLMASEGTEYDIDEEYSMGTDIRERLSRQRQMLNSRLRIGPLAKLDVDLNELITNEDLMPSISNPAMNRQSSQTESPLDCTRQPVTEIMRQQLEHNYPHPPGLSSREMNRAKRKARQAALLQKQRSHDDDNASTSSDTNAAIDSLSSISDEPEKKKIKLDKFEDGFGNGCPLPDGTWPAEVTTWPLEPWFCWLTSQLFSATWEGRHGAATAIREALKIHGHGAGKERGMTKEQMRRAVERRAEDACVRLVCVLGLDRFGDFVSDQVVAPVRESAAQALGVAAALLAAPRAARAAAALARLAAHPHWEARHGGALGFKYIAAARQDPPLQTLALKAALRALRDPAEDVGAAAAGALAGCAGALCGRLPRRVGAAARALWRLLGRRDELAAAAARARLALLAALLAAASDRRLLPPVPLKKVLPRLWPYLNHPSSSVRKAALQTMRTLTQLSAQNMESDNPSKENGNSKREDGLVNETESSDLQLENVDDEVCDDESSEISEISEEEDNANGGAERVENGGGVEDTTQWEPALLQVALRHVFQRVLVEHVPEIQDIAEEVWEELIKASSLSNLLLATCPMVSTWLCLAMQPSSLPFDSNMLLQARPLKERHSRPPSQTDNYLEASHPPVRLLQHKLYIGGSETIPTAVRESNLIRARSKAANMLGLLSCHIVKPAPGIDYTNIEEPIDCYVRVLLAYLSSCGALQRLVIGLVVGKWVHRCAPEPTPQALVSKLHHALNVPIYYDEVAATCNKIMQETKDFIATMKHYKIFILDEEAANIVNLDQVVSLTSSYGPAKKAIEESKLKNRIMQTLESRRTSINTNAVQCMQEYTVYNISTLAALAGACANLSALPEKLNPVIKPLMESIKKEPEEILQKISAADLAILLSLCVDRDPCPNVKVMMNLRTFLCCDPEATPRAIEATSVPSSSKDESGESSNDNSNHVVDFGSDKFMGILTLSLQQRQAEKTSFRRSYSNAIPGSGAGTNLSGNCTAAPLPRGPGRPQIGDTIVDDVLPGEDENQKSLWIQRRGAGYAFVSLVRHFGEELPQKLPKLWDFIMLPFNYIENEEADTNSAIADELIMNLQIVETVATSLAKELLPRLLGSQEIGALQALPALLRHPITAVRHMAARCTAALADITPHRMMQMIVNQVVAMLEANGCIRRRQGAAEALACVVDKLQINIVPYIVLLVVPLLRRMSDQDTEVRLMSTRSFASLIRLMPLEEASELPFKDAKLSDRRDADRVFLHHLFNPKLIPDYKVPVPIRAQLREYQQAGVNWLSFLNRYGLHGVLCDDMGLGKTLQSICMIASDHYLKRKKNPKTPVQPSLVICPQTLTGHWVYEVNKFLTKSYLNPLQYVGPPFEREKLRTKFRYHNLIVASYDIVRKDISFFSTIKWNYCILDEGHIIKNGKTKASKAIKTLVANNRLILSGTPIQNNVLELWSLFDFLMPGLLGTERQFTVKYSRPILAARDPRATSHHQEAGALAMEALHRQVLPFLLRRMKEDVLTELPPKIMQDYYCELSPLQRRLYEDFSKTHLPEGLEGIESHGHIFQALRYLQNVCNHPKLVLTEQHPQYDEFTRDLTSDHIDIQHSAKLPALMQLLQDCGIGCTTSPEASSVISQHRALIFCQLRSMLDIVEFDLLKAKLPSVSYLRLDGRVPPSSRHQVVHRFNTDPSIDVLLLTTQVGGLGLNLTGADTVIFVEHDWNPMKDLQAMDRAHRIGQKRVVNVYRLITRGTLEERIMGLQKFKLLTANTVISNENACLETMATDQLLDLFHLSDGPQSSSSGSQPSSSSSAPHKDGAKMTMKTVLDNLPELWDDKQYEEEYDMATFIQKLKR